MANCKGAKCSANLTWFAVGQIFDRGAESAARLGELLAVERVLAGTAVDVHCTTQRAQRTAKNAEQH